MNHLVPWPAGHPVAVAKYTTLRTRWVVYFLEYNVQGHAWWTRAHEFDSLRDAHLWRRSLNPFSDRYQVEEECYCC